MKCAKCGAEIRPGCVYCSNCGQEAQIVTEINILEDDLLRSMLEEEQSGSQTETPVKVGKETGKTEQKLHDPKTTSDVSKKKKNQILEKKRKKARKTFWWYF